jgi:hypothetical protein
VGRIGKVGIGGSRGRRQAGCRPSAGVVGGVDVVKAAVNKTEAVGAGSVGHAHIGGFAVVEKEITIENGVFGAR